MYQNEFCNILHSYDILSEVPSDQRSDRYRMIMRFLEFKIHENCNHEIVEDSIDINVEYSRTIHYCDTCKLSFNIDFFYSYFITNLKYGHRNLWRLDYKTKQYNLLNYSLANNKIILTIYDPNPDIDISSRRDIPLYLKDLFSCRIENNILCIY